MKILEEELVRNHVKYGSEECYEVGKPLSYGSLAVFPLFARKDGNVEYLVYSEALERDLVTVVEFGESGSVPELLVSNKGDERVLIVDGEQLVGAKQNRVLNTTVLVEANTDIVIPVSCVEQGRWRYEREKTMKPSTAHLYAMARAKKSCDVTANLTSRASFCSNQHAIWHEISERLGRDRVNSPTMAMEDHYELRKRDLSTYLEALDIANPQTEDGRAPVGAVFAIGESVIGMDAFNRSDALRKLWSGLLNSYALESLYISGEATTDRRAVRGFLRAASSAEMRAFDSPGIGKDVRIIRRGFSGGCLVAEGEAIHFYLFKVASDGGRNHYGRSPRIASFRDRARGRRYFEL